MHDSLSSLILPLAVDIKHTAQKKFQFAWKSLEMHWNWILRRKYFIKFISDVQISLYETNQFYSINILHNISKKRKNIRKQKGKFICKKNHKTIKTHVRVSIMAIYFIYLFTCVHGGWKVCALATYRKAK